MLDEAIPQSPRRTGTQAMSDTITVTMPIEAADEIVKAWLKLHMAWAQDAYDKAIHPEDRDTALADLHAFSQVLNYAGGGDD